MPSPIRATRLLPEGEGKADGPVVRLGFDDRHRRRLIVRTVSGEDVLIDLPQAVHLRSGARLQMEDGRTLTVEAADEAVTDITAPTADALTRLAYHLGNRHTPLALLPGRLRIRPDHVLEAMVERLGGTVARSEGAFDPEPGAYHDGHAHAHGHAHDDGHSNGDAHSHGDAHERSHADG